MGSSSGYDETLYPATTEDAAGDTAAGADDDPRVGTVISGRYRLLARVGQGGMGAVYRGEHVALRKRVAVKFLHAEMSRVPDVVARFEREAVAAAHLEHPNIVAAHDFGKTEDGLFFLVMEYVDGRSLREVLDAEGRLGPERALHIARHIAAALKRAHALGIVHRDLKPENVVLVEREGDRDFAKVIDFGVAKVAAGALSAPGGAVTQAGMVFGTPKYMAPEQALGSDVDHRADLYAFGVMLFEMFTGQLPFAADDVVALMGKHITAPCPSASETAPPRALPPSIDPVFTKILAKSPRDRFDSALEVVQGLEEALGRRGDAAFGQSPRPRRRGAWLVLAVLGLAAGGAVAAKFALERKPAAPAVVLPSGAADSTPTRGAGARGAGARGAVSARTPGTTSTDGEPVDTAGSPGSGAARPSSGLPPVEGVPAALVAELAAFRARPDVARLLGNTRGARRAQAIAALERMRAQSPGNGVVAFVLGSLYASGRRGTATALERYAEALRTRAGFARDANLVRYVTDLCLRARTPAPAAVALLEGPLAPLAARDLIETVLEGRAPRQRQRAEALLRAPALHDQLDDTERNLFALVRADTCDQMRGAVVRLGRVGDARALPYLRRLTLVRRVRCGIFGLGRCAEPTCLAHAVPTAIRAIERRRR